MQFCFCYIAGTPSCCRFSTAKIGDNFITTKYFPQLSFSDAQKEYKK